MRIIVGFSGPKYSGKSTAAQIMIAASGGGHEYGYARHLKDDVVRPVFGLSSEETDGVYKERPFDVPINIDEFLPQMSYITKLPLRPRGIVARTPRELMQAVGTEYVRSVQDDYWVQHLIGRISADMSPAFVVDVRFENEREALREIGGLIVHLVGRGGDAGDQHESEWRLPIHQDEVVIDNSGSLERLREKLLPLLSMKLTGAYGEPG